MGKHIDKPDPDAAKGIGTLPVLLGERPARCVTVSLMVLQYVQVAYLVIISFFLPEMFFTPVMLVVFLSLPMFLNVVLPMYRHPRPAERPEDYPAEASLFGSWLPPLPSPGGSAFCFWEG